MLWICFGIAAGLLLYWLFAPREEEVILLVSGNGATDSDLIFSDNN